MSKRPPQRRASTSKAPAALLGAAPRDLNEGVFIAERRQLAEGLRIVSVNEAFYRMTCLNAAELTGRSHGFLPIAHADLLPLRRWHARLMTSKPLLGQGYLSHKSHGTVYAAWTYRVLHHARGRVTHVVGSYRDLTSQRNLQEELTHSERLDAVGRLAGGGIHDFNNLLSIINGYGEILTDTLDDNMKARKEVAGILTADGYPIIATKSPAKGLREARKLAKPIHGVCVDPSDRAGDGERLIRAPMTSHPALRLACTSNPDTPPLHALAASRQTCLPKPFALSALFKAVRAPLDAP
jgi:PAS domain S-box-containing protein